MVHTYVTDVLVAGADPVGLTAAAELRRRGVSCRIVDRLPARLPFANAGEEYLELPPEVVRIVIRITPERVVGIAAG